MSLRLPERPSVTRTVLPNGLTLLVQEDHAHPLVAFQAVVRTGSATEGPFLGTGISHVLEHMLFKGTARRAVGAVEREARSYGGTSQGFTTYDTTSYQLVVGREHWAKAADLLVDALFFSSLDPGEFEKERQVVLRELKLRRDDPMQQVWDRLFSQAYPLHPYRLPIIGEEALVRGLTAEDLRAYYQLHYTPNQMTVAVVGDCRPDEVIRAFRELTANIPPGRLTLPILPQEPLPLSAQEVAEESDEAVLGMAALGFPGFSVRDPDLFALDLLAWVLGGGRGSLLEKSLRDTGLVHAVNAWNYTPLDRGLFLVTVRMDPEKRDEVLTALRQQLEKVRSEPLPEAEIAAAKKAFLRDYLAGRQSVAGQASDLAGYAVLTGDPLFSFRYLEQVDRLTSKDLQRVAQAVLKLEQSTWVTLLPKGQGGDPAPAGQKAEKAEVRTEKVRLSNGVRLILREDRRLPLITFHAALLGGVRFETDETNGLSGLTSRMLARGTRSRSADQVNEELKRIGAEAVPYSGRNSLGITLETVSASAVEAADLLRQLLLEPAFSPEDLEKERRLALAALKAQEEDPFSWGGKRLMATLFTRHPYRLDPSGTAAALGSFKVSDLKRFYDRVLDPKNLVLCVTGDFRREALEPALRKAFGTFGAAAREQEMRIPQEPPLEKLRERREPTPREEGILLIGFPGLKVEDARLPALDLLETVLSGGAGRLFSEIRERHGLAYTMGAYGMPGVDPGAFVLYAVTDPARLEQVRQAIFAELDRIRSTPVGAAELAEAREGFLGERRRNQQSQRAWAGQAAADELYGLGFDHAERYEARIRAVTSEQIRDLARELLDPQHCVVVIGEPASSSDGSPSLSFKDAAR